MEAAPPALYRPRRPQESPLYRLVADHFDTLVQVHEEKYQRSHGRLRPACRRAVDKFLACGILDHGFARVRCASCRAEFLLATSCKTRLLCPSCHAKRLEIWSDWLEHELLYAVHLSRTGRRSRRRCLHSNLRHSGDWHPHLHLVVTDGAFRPDGTFLHLGFHEVDVLVEAFRRAVLREFVRRQLLAPDAARAMLAWPHSGFHVHHAVRLEADDAHGILQLARYAARAPVALDRLQYLPDQHAVRLASDKRDGPTAGAELLQRLFEVDPLACPRCGAAMRIVAFILDVDVIHAILRHLRRNGRDPRALPEHDARFARAPP